MKITFNFDRDCRAFNMEPEDDLEFAVLNEMTKATTKGQSISLSRIDHQVLDAKAVHTEREQVKEFRVEMRVNGHQARVAQSKE
jgi:hypothetical protein